MDDQHIFRFLCESWFKLFDHAKKKKRKEFGDDAAIAMKYFRGSAKEIWGSDNIYRSEEGQGFLVQAAVDDEQEILPPSFQICLDKVSELVQLFGPSFYMNDPHRTVTPRVREPLPIEWFGDPNNPFVAQAYQQQSQQMAMQNMADAQLARVLEKYLNYTPHELKLRKHSRRVIDEATIKGMGIWLPQSYRPYPKAKPIIGSFYRTIDDLLVDPDEREELDDAKWIAIRCVEPYQDVEREYKQPKNSLKKYANLESAARQADTNTGSDHPDDDRESGRSNDLLTYYKLYSKMGLGSNISGVDKELKRYIPDIQYAYLVLVRGCPYPLNMSTKKFHKLTDQDDGGERIKNDVQWPVPFWADNRWPFVPLMFHPQPNSLWPMSHIKPGLGLLNFLNWCIGFLAAKVRTSSQTTVAVLKAASDELKRALFNGRDFNIVELEDSLGKNISEIVSILQAPPMNSDIWRVIEWAISEFEKATGLTEVLYGTMSRQDRSATESKLRFDSASTRVDDMRGQVEEALTELARHEAFMARYLLTGEDVRGPVGAQDAMVWDRMVSTDDVERIVQEFEYHIEADTARKPNRQSKIAAIQELRQYFLPVYSQFAGMGVVEPFNQMAALEGKLLDIELPQLPPPQPPDPNAPPPPEEQKIQAEIQLKQNELAMKQAEGQARMAESQMQMQAKQQEAQQQLAIEQAKFQLERQRAAEQVAVEQRKLEMEAERLELDKQRMEQELLMEQAKAQLDAQLEQQKMVMEVKKQEMAMEMKREETQAKMALEKQKAESDARIKQQECATKSQLAADKHAGTMRMADEKHHHQMHQSAVESQQKLQIAQRQADAEVGSKEKVAREESKARMAKKRKVKKRVTRRDEQGRLSEWEETDE